MSKSVATTNYTAFCNRCTKTYNCTGHQKCPNCGGIHRVTFKPVIKETKSNATAGV